MRCKKLIPKLLTKKNLAKKTKKVRGKKLLPTGARGGNFHRIFDFFTFPTTDVDATKAVAPK